MYVVLSMLLCCCCCCACCYNGWRDQYLEVVRLDDQEEADAEAERTALLLVEEGRSGMENDDDTTPMLPPGSPWL